MNKKINTIALLLIICLCLPSCTTIRKKMMDDSFDVSQEIREKCGAASDDTMFIVYGTPSAEYFIENLFSKERDFIPGTTSFYVKTDSAGNFTKHTLEGQEMDSDSYKDIWNYSGVLDPSKIFDTDTRVIKSFCLFSTAYTYYVVNVYYITNEGEYVYMYFSGDSDSLGYLMPIDVFFKYREATKKCITDYFTPEVTVAREMFGDYKVQVDE